MFIEGRHEEDDGRSCLSSTFQKNQSAEQVPLTAGQWPLPWGRVTASYWVETPASLPTWEQCATFCKLFSQGASGGATFWQRVTVTFSNWFLSFCLHKVTFVIFELLESSLFLGLCDEEVRHAVLADVEPAMSWAGANLAAVQLQALRHAEAHTPPSQCSRV